jgi:hypothetical protein
MREFTSLDEAKRWAVCRGCARGVKVAVRGKVYRIEVSEPFDDLRRQIRRQEELGRIWRGLGVLVVIAWALAILWIIGL